MTDMEAINESLAVRARAGNARLASQCAQAKRQFNKVSGLRLPMKAQFFTEYWPIALEALKKSNLAETNIPEWAARLEQRQLETQAMLSALLDMLAEDAQDEPQALDLSGQPIPRERGENEPL